MSIELGRMSYNAEGDPKVTITVKGNHDLYRLSDVLVRGQCDMAAIGFKMQKRQKRKIGKARWDWLMRYMHGDGGYR